MWRFYQVLGIVALGLAVLSILGTWFGIWQAHREKVDDLRLVHGQDAIVPAFNPLKFFDPDAIPPNVEGLYTVALAMTISAILLLLLSRFRKPRPSK